MLLPKKMLAKLGLRSMPRHRKCWEASRHRSSQTTTLSCLIVAATTKAIPTLARMPRAARTKARTKVTVKKLAMMITATAKVVMT